MRMITGAIIVLSGVIPLCFGVMLEFSQWFGDSYGWPVPLQIGGGIGILAGVILIISGFVNESHKPPQN